jgi:hypothetical protein
VRGMAVSIKSDRVEGFSVAAGCFLAPAGYAAAGSKAGKSV